MTQQKTVDYILEQIEQAGLVRAKKMFGGYCIYCDEKVVALVCDDQLFVKMTEAGKEFLGEWNEKPAYPGAKNSFYIPGETWDDADWLTQLIQITASDVGRKS